ncbi:unnamed protein product [Rhizophagus irregularis]|nr:unnamed protein product [Rhizophagus irregularis]CAB5307560.1 unnamed protein product [Rhizophagus irregularis]
MKIIYFDGKTFLSSFFFNFFETEQRPTSNNTTQVNEVIPKHLIINIPQEMQDYILPNVNRTMLENLHLNKC